MRLSRPQRPDRGYVMPLTIGLGSAMLILGLTATLLVQTDRSISQQRQQNGVSLAVAEGAADRLMAQLSMRHNAILLGRNYDPINPDTNETYLGADAQPNSGDETNTPVDEWTGFTPSGAGCFIEAGVGNPNLPLSGSIGAATYQVLAYRYHPNRQTGTLLIRSDHRGQQTTLAIELRVTVDWQNFPTVVGLQSDPNPMAGTGAVALRGRKLSGNANVYYNNHASADSSLTGSAAPGDTDRNSYLTSLWNSPVQDGTISGSDPVSGKITACGLAPTPTYPAVPSGTLIIHSSTTLTGEAGRVTQYWIDKLNLDNHDILTVDTTAGPVELHIKGDPAAWWYIDFTVFALADHAKIVNVRTDGQAPRVGDLRIISNGHHPLSMTGQTCIQNALLWMPLDEIWLMTSGPGCAGGRGTNFEGVVWAEAILSSKNAPTNRNVTYLGSHSKPYDTTITPGATSGIFVPDDLSSLNDLFPRLNWPTRYRIRDILGWRQVRM